MRAVTRVWSVLAAAALAGCAVGPDYQRPSAVLPRAFSEAPPSGDGWRPAAPRDQALRADWWTLFGDPRLDALEAQVDAANQTLKQSEATFRAARAAVRYSRAAELPTVGAAPFVGAVRDSANGPYFNRAAANGGETELSLPLDLNYEIDLWGRIRRGVTYARDQAQAAAADRETVRLSLHAELAIDYFNLRAAISLDRLLDDTVKAYQQALDLTQDRYKGDVSPLTDVAQARTQLEAAQVEKTDVAVERAAYQHAITVLTGGAAAAAADPIGPLMTDTPAVPAVPGFLPSDLLERRPDVAGAERRMAAANEQIGIAKAAYFPTLSLSAAAGAMATAGADWFTWPSRFWAVGPTLSQTLYDHGRLRANSEIARADYDGAVAGYRQAVLTAVQQVEDNLAALRELQTEAAQQHAATDSARQTLELFQARYQGGVDTYLQVVTWQTSYLENQRNDIEISRRRLEAAVLLAKALGGGWTTQELPSVASLP